MLVAKLSCIAFENKLTSMLMMEATIHWEHPNRAPALPALAVKGCIARLLAAPKMKLKPIDVMAIGTINVNGAWMLLRAPNNTPPLIKK